MNDTTETSDCHYDYANKCDCSEDDKCGCTFPNNLAHDYSPGCFEEKEPLHPHMELTVGMAAPDFTAPAVLSDNTLVEHFNFYKYTRGKLAVLFFYPEDFSFTCPSELLMLNRELNAFSKRNTRVLAISTDSVHSHLAWKELPPEKDGVSDINFPMIADLDKKISAHYGILSKKETALRATVIIDEKKIIRHMSINDNKIWRNPEETLRILDILNQKDDTLTSCPKGWKQNFFFERPEPESLTEMFSHRDN